MKLLKVALEKQNYELAAHALVYGLLKTKAQENGKKRRTKRQSERQEAQLLQPGS